MTYTVVVNFKDGTSQTFNADSYSHANGVLEIFNFNGAITNITLFPLEDLSNVKITQGA